MKPRAILINCITACLFGALLQNTATAQTSATWTLAGNGNWSTAANWSTNPVAPINGQPLAGDLYNATLSANRIVTLDVPVVIQTLAQSTGTITGTSPLTLNTGFNWSGGTMSGASQTTLGASASATLSTSNLKTLQSRTFNNDGTVAMGGGNLRLSTSADFNNNNSFSISDDSDFDTGSSTATFDNAGTFTKSGGAATTDIGSGITFNNTGTVNANSGTLLLTSGGTHSGGFAIASGAKLEFKGTHAVNAGSSFNVNSAGTFAVTGGTTTVTPAATIAGTTTLTSGTLTFNNSAALNTANLTGGTLNGSGNITASGLTTWLASNVAGAAGTIYQANGGLTFTTSSNNSRDLDGRTLNNPGAATFSADAGGSLRLVNNAVINNSGTWTATTGFGITGSGTFNNLAGATYRRNAGTANTISVPFHNAGTVEVNASTFTLSGGGNHTGGFSVSGGTLTFGGGAHAITSGPAFTVNAAGSVSVAVGTVGTMTVTPAAAIAGTTTLTSGTLTFNNGAALNTANLTAGILNGSGNITASGLTTWLASTVAGAAGTIYQADGGLTFTTSSNNRRDLDGRTLNNPGAATFSADAGGSLRLVNNAVINNSGTWTATTDFGITGSGTFNNLAGATYRRNAGTANTISVPFHNAGTVEVNASTLTLSGGGNHTGGFSVSGGTLTFGGGAHAITSGPAFTVNAAGSVSVAVGTVGTMTVTPAAAIAGTTTLTSGTLTFSNGAALSIANLTGGFLNGSGNITASGLTTWLDSDVAGAAGTIYQADGGLTFTTSSNNTRTLDGRTLNNPGAATCDATVDGSLVLANSAVVNNSGTWTATTAFGISGSGTFNNLAGATYRRNAGTANTISVPFHNAGTVEVNASTLTLANVAQHSVTLPVSLTGGTWNVNAATLTFSSGSNITRNQANVTLDGAAATFTKFTAALNVNEGSLTLKNNRDLTTVGALANSGALRVEDATTLLTVTGAYTQTAGSTTLVGDAQITPSGGFNLQGGTLAGTGSINGNLVSSGSPLVAPGTSAGSITVTGTASLTGTLAMQIGGLVPATGHDQLLVGGNLNLGGLLTLALIDGFTPAFGENIVLVDAGSLSGNFSNVLSGSRHFTIDGQHSFAVHYGPGSPFGADKVVLSSFSDILPPVLTLPDDIVEEATGPVSTLVSFTVSANDAVQGSVAAIATPASGTLFPVPDIGNPQLPLGVTTVNVTATDIGGNVANGSFTVTIEDTTPPVLTLPANIVAEATGPAGRVVSYSVSATDIVDLAPAFTFDHPSGSVFPLGTTTVHVTATDDESNQSSGSFTVTIVDTTPATLGIPANITAEATAASGATVSFSVTASDIVDGVIVPISNPASGSIFPLGATTVNVAVTDAALNTATASFTVTVVDTTDPIITMPAPITAEATGATGASVNFTVTVTDIVDTTPNLVVSPPSGSLFPLGETTVTCTGTDDTGNESINTFTVTVVDTTDPVITVPAPITVEATSVAGAVVNFAVSATDLVNGVLVPTASPPSGSTFPAGITTVEVTVTDAAGNSATASFNVEVTVEPDIFVKETGGAEIADGTGTAVFNPTDIDAAGAVKSYTIRNDGTTHLHLGAITIDGDHAAEFSATGPVAVTLAPAQSTTFTATFSPSFVGIRNAVLHLANDDPDAAESSYDFILTGTGTSTIPPAFAASPVITPATSGIAAKLSAAVTGPPGATVKLEASTDLGHSDAWQVIGQVIPDGSGNGTFTNVADPGSIGAPKDFFRLRIDP